MEHGTWNMDHGSWNMEHRTVNKNQIQSIPKYYLGENVELLRETWKNQYLVLGFPAKSYIQNIIPKFEFLFGKELKPNDTPMSEGFHPEVDDTPIYTLEVSAKYSSMIGCCIWIIVLRRLDIAYATSAISRFIMKQ